MAKFEIREQKIGESTRYAIFSSDGTQVSDWYEKIQCNKDLIETGSSCCFIAGDSTSKNGYNLYSFMVDGDKVNIRCISKEPFSEFLLVDEVLSSKFPNFYVCGYKTDSGLEYCIYHVDMKNGEIVEDLMFSLRKGKNVGNFIEIGRVEIEDNEDILGYLLTVENNTARLYALERDNKYVTPFWVFDLEEDDVIFTKEKIKERCIAFIDLKYNRQKIRNFFYG